MPLNLAVIESRWWTEGNSSIRGLFDLLADIHTENPGDYHYEMFNNARSLREIILRVSNRSRNIYIAAHGDEGQTSIFGAEGLEENKVSRTELRNIVRDSNFRGLFVGSCWFK